MNTLETVGNIERHPDIKTERKSTKKRDFEVEKPHRDPKFYEVHKHIENLLAFLSQSKKTKEGVPDNDIKTIEEIRIDTKEQKEGVLALREKLESSSSLEGMGACIEYGLLAVAQSDEADRLAKNIRGHEEMNDVDVTEKLEIINIHIDNGEKLRLLKEKVEEFYEKADEKTRESLDFVLRSVERVMLNTNAFIVHLFLFDEKQNDIDVISSLQPSLLTSSIVAGAKQGLPQGKSGIILNGGTITGIKGRDEDGMNKVPSYKEIYERISDSSERPYNEIIVKNPEIFGFFLNVEVDDNGELYDFKTTVPEDAIRFKNDFMRNMNLAASRGFPQLVMTPDRRMFEFLSIDDTGVVHVGNEVTPEQVAKSKVAVSQEKRKELAKSIG